MVSKYKLSKIYHFIAGFLIGLIVMYALRQKYEFLPMTKKKLTDQEKKQRRIDFILQQKTN